MRKITLLIIALVIQHAVSAQVTCAFTASTLSGCPPLSVNFQDQSTGATSYYWEFDNGNTSTLVNPATNYNDAGIYNVMHVAINGSQSDTEYLQIRVFNPPSVNFMSPNPEGCNSPCHLVNFANQTIPGESAVQPGNYVWDFGHGSADTGYNATHCYPLTGNFTVTLIARDDNGCQVSKTVPNFVTIVAGPVANASASPTQSCASSLPVNFTGAGSSPNGVITYRWNFDDGTSSPQQNPVHTFNCGVFNPVLSVTDAIGCIAKDTLQIDVPCLNAGFTTTSTNGCTGIPVQFTDTSNFATSWSWDFGDGGTSTSKNPTHTYANNGNYTVRLTVSYAGCTDTETRTSYVSITSPVNFTLSADNYTNCTVPFTVNFTNTATGATGYNWNFGDGGTSTLSNPSHTYTTTGTFTVTLGVSNAAGCVNTQTLNTPVSVGALRARFTVNNNNGCSPLAVQFTNTSTSNVAITSYSWNFDDLSAPSTVASPSHVYAGGQYKPVLTVTDANGCTASYTYPGTINVGTTLNAAFSATPIPQCVNQNVVFTNLTPGTTGSTTYSWDFGDNSNNISTAKNPVYKYSDVKFYTVTLTVINQGCTSTVTRTNYIQIVDPKADFFADYTCLNPTTVTFTDASQGADTYSWDFGDGATSALPSPVHTYPAQGTYSVTLTVTNNTTGCIDSKTYDLGIGTPQAAFTSNKVDGCARLTVQFTDTSKYATSWLWRFGDGTTSTAQNPTHNYTATGQYKVTLIINPGAVCTDSVVKTNYITVYGISGNIVLSRTQGCTPFSVNISQVSNSYMGTITSYKWIFDSGKDSSTTPSTSYIFTEEGVRYVELYVSDSHGCTARFVESVILKDVIADFTATDTTACPGDAISFTNMSSNSTTYLWNFGDNTTSTSANPSHVYTAPGTYTVTLRSTGFGGCSHTATRTDYIRIEAPIADFYVNTNFAPCPPFPIKFYNTTNRNDLQWLWYFGDGDTSTAKEPLHVYFFPGNYDVTLIVSNGTGCIDTVTYNDIIRVRGPIGNFDVSTDSGCVPLTVTYSGSVQPGVSIISDLGDGTAYNDSINITHEYKEHGKFYPVFTLTDSVGCRVSYPVDTIVVGLIPYPNLPVDTTVCRGNYVQFNLPLGDHFQWTANQTPAFLICDTCRNAVATARDTITYFVTALTDIGCQAKDTITVNVDALPQIFPGLHFRICPNDTLQLNAGPGVTAATWTPFQYMNDANIVNPLVWPNDTMIYRVTGANSTGCTISRIVKVWPIQKVVADMQTNDTMKCEGGDVMLDVRVLQSSYNDTSFQWIPSTYLSSATIRNPMLNAPAGDYTYTVIIRSSTCEADTESVRITFKPTPTVEAGDDQLVAEGTTVQLWASSPDQVSYTWLQVADPLSCNDCRRPYVTATKEQTIPVVVTSQHGCTDTAFVKLRVVSCDEKMVFVPNTFTPNNDDLNDRLYVRGGGLRSLEYFRVFDRWGKMVWETRNLNEGWDGTVNGKKSDLATYVYLLKGECSSGAQVQKSGNVTLIR